MTLAENTPLPVLRQTGGTARVQIYPSTEFALRLAQHNEGLRLLKRYAVHIDDTGPSAQESTRVFDRLAFAEEYTVILLAKTAAPGLEGLEAKLAILVERLKQWAVSDTPSPFEAATIDLARSALEDAAALRGRTL